MGLSAAQIGMIQSSWKIIEQDLQGNGKVMFAKAFEDADVRGLWKFTIGCSGKPEDQPELAGHVTKIFTRLGEVISKMGDEAAMLTTLKNTGATHGPYGIKPPSHAPVIGGALIHMLATKMGADFTADMKAAWLAAWDIIVATMFQ